MRVEKAGISVHAIAGSRAVLFGFDADATARAGLLGFALGRRRANGSILWNRGFKFFAETVPDPAPGERRSTREHPVQAFQWGDYTAQPGETRDYVVQAVYGQPDALTYGPEIDLPVQTANAEGSSHNVYFNRGAIPSQAFADRFGNVGPTQDEQNDPTNEKTIWLSRGLLEAALGFIAEADGPGTELRVGAYEFVYQPIVAALAAAAGRGATVQISFDGGDQRRDGSIVPSHTSGANWDAIRGAGLDQAAGVSLHPRTLYSSIPHNKFIILRRNGVAEAVWTGSTNFTPSGFLGQSNVGHLIRDPALAAAYDTYWQELATDPKTTPFKTFNTTQFPGPAPGALPQDGVITPVFSPRRKGMLEWYAEALKDAQASTMFTAAFGVARPLAAVFGENRDFLRFLLMERRDSRPEVQAQLTRDRDTLIALGSGLNTAAINMKLGGHALDEWFKREEHFRKMGHIFYIHTKIMGLDLLSDNPLLFTGSANFSKNSVEYNDENMLLMHGPAFRQVADVYVTEFMRLFNHLYFRTIAVRNARRRKGIASKAAVLVPDDSWVAAHFTDHGVKGRKRLLFR